MRKSIIVNFLDYNSEEFSGRLESGKLFPEMVTKEYADTPYFMNFENRSYGDERGVYVSLIKNGTLVSEGVEIEEWNEDKGIWVVIEFNPIEI